MHYFISHLSGDVYNLGGRNVRVHNVAVWPQVGLLTLYVNINTYSLKTITKVKQRFRQFPTLLALLPKNSSNLSLILFNNKLAKYTPSHTPTRVSRVQGPSSG